MGLLDYLAKIMIEVFRYDNGAMFCEEINLAELLRQCEEKYKGTQTPLFVYSKRKLQQNVREYMESLQHCGSPYQLNFAIKANPNLAILKELQALGTSATLVSGNELRMALEAGFDPTKIMYNGGGKCWWETKLAIEHGVIINVDSEWDLQQTIDICKTGFPETRQARVMLRLNLDIDPQVHKFINTGLRDCKFGLSEAAAEACLLLLEAEENCPVKLVGLHSHMGSTIYQSDLFRQSVERMLAVREKMTHRGFKEVNILNVGGGLGIDYMEKEPETRPWRSNTESSQNELLALKQFLIQKCESDSEVKTESRASEVKEQTSSPTAETEDTGTCSAMRHMANTIVDYEEERISFDDVTKTLSTTLNHCSELKSYVEKMCPLLTCTRHKHASAKDLIQSVSGLLKDNGVTLMLEPGRSLVANTCVLITRVLGCKRTVHKRYAVVDASMTEVIRPSLYGSYHHVTVAAMTQEVTTRHRDKDVYDVVGPVCESTDFIAKDRLLPDPTNALLVVHDVGAYCHSMSSNYNIRMKAAEVMVDGSSWCLIRRQDTFQDFLEPYKNLD